MRLKELRKQKHLTQAEIAKQLNVAISTYSGYELGTSEPSIEVLKELSKIFTVPIDYIVNAPQNGYYIEKWKLSDIQLENLELIKNLNMQNNYIAKGYLTKIFQDQIVDNKTY